MELDGLPLDARSRTLRVEVYLPNPEGKLHPGLYAYASIVAEEHPNALSLPTSAIIRDGDKVSCVVVKDGRAAPIDRARAGRWDIDRGALWPGRHRGGGEGQRRFTRQGPVSGVGGTSQTLTIADCPSCPRPAPEAGCRRPPDWTMLRKVL